MNNEEGPQAQARGRPRSQNRPHRDAVPNRPGRGLADRRPHPGHRARRRDAGGLPAGLPDHGRAQAAGARPARRAPRGGRALGGPGRGRGALTLSFLFPVPT